MSPAFLLGVYILHVNTRSVRLGSQYYLVFCVCLLLALITLRCTSPLVSISCKNFVLLYKLCFNLCQLYDDICEAFTQQGYSRLQELALATNHAENPLIPGVTIRCGMLTWYGAGWCLSWGLIKKTQLTVLRISTLKHHDKETKPELWSLNSEMTRYISSIQTAFIYVFSVEVCNPSWPHSVVAEHTTDERRLICPVFFIIIGNDQ